MAFPASLLASAKTWFDNQLVNGALIDTYITGPLNALRPLIPQTVTGTITIPANGNSKSGTISLPAGLANAPAILSVMVIDGRAVTANYTGGATAAGVPVNVLTTAGNSVGSTAVTYTIAVVYAGV